jgi:hypothetical protein
MKRRKISSAHFSHPFEDCTTYNFLLRKTLEQEKALGRRTLHTKSERRK